MVRITTGQISSDKRVSLGRDGRPKKESMYAIINGFLHKKRDNYTLSPGFCGKLSESPMSCVLLFD